MQTIQLKEYLQSRGYGEEKIEKMIEAVMEFQHFCQAQDPPRLLDEISADMVEKYMELLIETSKNDVETLRSLGGYFYATRRHDLYIQMTKYLGSVGVMDSIRQRIGTVENEEIAGQIFENLDPLPVGTAPADMPVYTRQVIRRLENLLPQENLETALAGNHHRIPADALLEEKEKYEQAPSLDEYLQDLHRRKVAELQRFCDENRIWYEQFITQEVVDFVQANQEILSAVRTDNCLYVTKIPYDAVRYIQEEDPREKAYYACHCPFARESIRQNTGTISANWCYCSGGFEKFPFEVILGKELKVKVLQSALNLDPVCRFEISLMGIDYKT